MVKFDNSTTGLPNLHGPHVAREAILCGLLSFFFYIFIGFSWINEIMKPDCTISISWFGKSTVVVNIMALLVKILRKICKIHLILLHAAYLKTWRTGVCWFKLEKPVLHALFKKKNIETNSEIYYIAKINA